MHFKLDCKCYIKMCSEKAIIGGEMKYDDHALALAAFFVSLGWKFVYWIVFIGLKVENVTPSSLNVSWEAVQTVKKGEPIEYLLQSQCVGKDPDFVQVA